jgi:multidrug efflux system membrane fusion protein
MKSSRITAVGLVAVAGLWIASGYFMPHESAESKAAVRPQAAAPEKLFRVAVERTSLVPHAQKLLVSGRTEADRKVSIAARTSGVLTELRVHRGDRVKAGDVIAVLADEGREEQVAQARAMVQQRRTELEARTKLIEKGMMPRLELVNLESQLKTAEAALANAEAERERGVVRAPWAGIINNTSVEVGQSSFSFMGTEIAQLVSLDPLLAVVEVAERKLGNVKAGDPAEVRLVTGQTMQGKIRFVSKTASDKTRTYRVEVELRNPDGAVPDGITAEVAIPMKAMSATRVPRSALTFASSGDLGVRTVGEGDKVKFLRVAVVEDEQEFMWVSGIPDGTRVIVQGQDFVGEGQHVEPVAGTQAVSSAK